MEIKDGVGYSSSGKVGKLFMIGGVAIFGDDDGRPFLQTPEVEKDYSSSEWSPWGDDNLLPVEMANHIENCGILSAALDAKARISVGKGIQPFLLVNIDKDGKEELEWVDDPEVQDWLENNDTFRYGYDMSYDRNAFGWSLGSFILNKGRNKINRIRRIDVTTARLQKYDDRSVIKNIFLCSDWEKAPTTFDTKKMAKIPVLRDGFEYQELTKRSDSYEYAFLNRVLRNSREYYPWAQWYYERAWVKQARSIPAFKNAMFSNQMQIKYVIEISPKYFEDKYEEWGSQDEATKQKHISDKYKEIDKFLTGEEKAYKSLASGKYIGGDGKEYPYITVNVLDDKVKDGKYTPDAAAANSQILIANNMNPSLIGAGTYGGNSIGSNAGGSNVRESYLTLLMLLEAERREICSDLLIVKQFNKWDRLEVERKTYPATAAGNTAVISGEKKMKPRLVFRNVSGLLTTLDTGKSTKAEPL